MQNKIFSKGDIIADRNSISYIFLRYTSNCKYFRTSEKEDFCANRCPGYLLIENCSTHEKSECCGYTGGTCFFRKHRKNIRLRK